MKNLNIWDLSPTFYMLLVSLLTLTLTGCGLQPASPTATPTLTPKIVFYDWVEDVPDQVLDAFEAEYGVEVKYETYQSQEEAIENIKAGAVYDVVVFDNRFIPGLIQENLVTKINAENLPNLTNISPTFRNLSFDREGMYRVPFNWGATGLLMQNNKMNEPVFSWQDLWNPALDGKVILWRSLPRENIGMSLKSLGYSVNTENPDELEKALDNLVALKANILFAEDVDENLDSSAPLLVEGYGVVSMAESYDYFYDTESNLHFVIPEDGAILWADNFVIPANSPNQYTAEVFLNYLLRPEIAALITNYNHCPTPNDAAKQYIDADILSSPAVYPEMLEMVNAEMLMPLSPAGEALYQKTWERFLAAEP